VNQRSEHLSDAQIEQYGKRASGAGPETEAWVETHLDDCPSCRSRVLEFQRTQFALLPDPKVNTVSSSNCPCEEDLRNLAAGLCAEPIAKKLKAHASNCERCGPLLQEYIEDFSDDVTPEEQAFLNQLRTASPEYRQQKAREMLQRLRPVPLPVPSPKPISRVFSWKWLTAPAAAAASCGLLAVGIGVTLYARRDTPEKAEKWMAQAYTEQRTFEMRWPGAEWGKFSPDRGPGGSLFSEPEPQHRAAKVIAKKLTTPDHSEWLRPRAELDLLEGHPGQAVSKLAPLENQTQSTALLLDLAIAYFQLGQKPDSPADKEHAIAILKRIISTNPNNPEALFNLGIAYTAIGSWADASATWHTYLSLDPTGSWANEVKAKLLQIEKMHPQSRRE
jgi:tetratricopeptide (TPR) repeat protein